MPETLYRIHFIKEGLDYFYVGKTKSYYRRMEQHLDESKDGAKWIEKNFDVDIKRDCVTTKLGDFEDATWEETRHTLYLMLKYGINNVRGAEYCEIKEYDDNDVHRITYAVIHHLDRNDADEIKEKLRQNIINSKIEREKQSHSGSSSSSSFVYSPPSPFTECFHHNSNTLFGFSNSNYSTSTRSSSPNSPKHNEKNSPSIHKREYVEEKNCVRCDKMFIPSMPHHQYCGVCFEKKSESEEVCYDKNVCILCQQSFIPISSEHQYCLNCYCNLNNY